MRACRRRDDQARRFAARDFSIYRHSFFGLNWIKYSYGVDRYLAVSNSVRQVLLNDGVREEKVEVVHSGVDPQRFDGISSFSRQRLRRELGWDDDMPVIGSVGALVPYKGFDDMLTAAAELLRRRRCGFVIVGEGEHRAHLEERIRAEGLVSAVRLLGFRDDIGAILAALDVFLFPAREEGLGTSVLDALLLRRPTVATRVGGVPEVIRSGENGLLVDVRDASAMAAAVESCLTRRQWAEEMAETGRATVLSRFSVDEMVEKTLQTYSVLLDNDQRTEEVNAMSSSPLASALSPAQAPPGSQTPGESRGLGTTRFGASASFRRVDFV